MEMLLPKFSVNLATGLLQPVIFNPSPHQDARPPGSVIELVVINNISLPPGEFGGSAIAAFFAGKLNPSSHPYYASIASLRVSAHLLLQRKGEVVQFVPFTQRAWHAGESQFAHKTHCNDFSIGIELEGTDDIAYTPLQYQQLALIIKKLQMAYPAITPERIVGHADIAPGRKTDPGQAFDWRYLQGLLK